MFVKILILIVKLQYYITLYGLFSSCYHNALWLSRISTAHPIYWSSKQRFHCMRRLEWLGYTLDQH